MCNLISLLPTLLQWRIYYHVYIPVNPPPFRGSLPFAQRFITIFNCRYHTSNHLSESHKPTSLSPINLLTLPLFTGVSRVRALSPAWTGSHAQGDINLPHTPFLWFINSILELSP
jgi:hypothetical protein